MPAFDHSVTYRERKLRHLPHRLRLKAIERAIRSLSLPADIAYADFGCSNGYITERIRVLTHANETWGFDHLNGHLERGRERYPLINFARIDLNESKEKSPQWDFATCFETLEHLGRPQVAIDSLLFSLRPNGVALITVPIEIGPRGIVKFAAKMVYGYDLSELPQRRWRFVHYLSALITGARISQFRDSRAAWGTHFGFDYRDIDSFLKRRTVKFVAWNQGTTRFYRVASPN